MERDNGLNLLQLKISYFCNIDNNKFVNKNKFLFTKIDFFVNTLLGPHPGLWKGPRQIECCEA